MDIRFQEYPWIYIHRNAMDVDMDMDRIFYLHGKPDNGQQLCIIVYLANLF